MLLPLRFTGNSRKIFLGLDDARYGDSEVSLLS